MPFWNKYILLSAHSPFPLSAVFDCIQPNLYTLSLSPMAFILFWFSHIAQFTRESLSQAATRVQWATRAMGGQRHVEKYRQIAHTHKHALTNNATNKSYMCAFKDTKEKQELYVIINIKEQKTDSL